MKYVMHDGMIITIAMIAISDVIIQFVTNNIMHVIIVVVSVWFCRNSNCHDTIELQLQVASSSRYTRTEAVPS